MLFSKAIEQLLLSNGYHNGWKWFEKPEISLQESPHWIILRQWAVGCGCLTGAMPELRNQSLMKHSMFVMWQMITLKISKKKKRNVKVKRPVHFCMTSNKALGFYIYPTIQQNHKTVPAISTSLRPISNELYRIGPAWLVSLTGTHISICSTWAGRGGRLGGSAAFSVTSKSFAATASSNIKSV